MFGYGLYISVFLFLVIDILGVTSSLFIVPITYFMAVTGRIEGECNPAIGTTMNILFYIRSLFDPLVYEILLVGLIW